jgi:high-affinity Fe2+/Pb2+ permease
MKAPRMRTVVIAAAAAVLMSLYLYVGGDALPWRPLLLAVGGLATIVALLLAAIWLQERADAKAAAENIARCRRVEADERRRREVSR